MTTVKTLILKAIIESALNNAETYYLASSLAGQTPEKSNYLVETTLSLFGFRRVVVSVTAGKFCKSSLSIGHQIKLENLNEECKVILTREQANMVQSLIHQLTAMN